jgi:hypothetical protein
MVLFFTIKKLNHLKKNLAHRWRSGLVFNRAGLKIFNTPRKMSFKGVRDEVICKPTCRKFDRA